MKLIHYANKMELAKLIVTSAPPKALWFNVVRKLPPNGVLVDYEPPTTRLSLRVLADELGLAGQGTVPKVEKMPKVVEKSREDYLHQLPLAVKDAWNQGKHGFVLLR
jgi:hypothetical protein